MSTANVSIYRREDCGVWWVNYQMGGKRVRESLGTSDEWRARKKAAAIGRRLNAGDGLDLRVTLSEFWKKYERIASKEKRPRTVRTDRWAWQRFSVFLRGEGVRYVDRVVPKHCEGFRVWMLSEGRIGKTSSASCEKGKGKGKANGKRGVSQNYVNILHRHLSSIFTFAVRSGYALENPWKGVKKYVVDDKKLLHLSDEQIKSVLETAESHGRNMHLVYALGIYAGLRRVEIANARWEWFDLKSETVTIEACGEFKPKGHRTVALPMNRKLSRVLKKYKSGQEEGFLFDSGVAEEERRHFIRYEFRNGFDSVKKKADLPWLTPHVLRHTFASQLVSKGVSIFKVSKWMGHKSVDTTMRYAHLQVHDDDINRI